MRIDHLSLENFKGFKKSDFQFPSTPGQNGSFHLIIGNNGTGKTSLLEALAVAMGSWLLGIPDYDSRHILKEDVRFETHEINGAIRLERQYPVLVEAKGVVGGDPIQWKRSLGSDNGRTDQKGAVSIRNKARELRDRRMQQSHHQDTVAPLLSYYGTGRLWVEPKDMQKKEDLSSAEVFQDWRTGYRLSVDPRCSPGDLLRWLRFEQLDAIQKQQETCFFRTVKKAICRVLENEGCEKVFFDLRENRFMVDLGKKGLTPFQALSDGLRNMVALVGDIAFKAAQLNAILGEKILDQTPGIVLIDELDLHLHPRWQQHVIDDLRRTFPRIQFIATTHSPFLIQSLRPGELISLDGEVLGEYANRGLEDVVVQTMGIENPRTTPRYCQMLDVAKNYFALPEKAEGASSADLEGLKKQLDTLSSPYADNPAYQAFLEIHRIAAFKE